MNPKQHSSEQGQAIVLMVLAMIVLLGFTALAVDGSMVYSDRRFTQSASDASSLAGGGVAAQRMGELGVTLDNFTLSGTTCTGNVENAASSGRTAAVSRASDNSFTIANNDLSGDLGVATVCGSEPVLANKLDSNGNVIGTYTLYTDKFIDVKTRFSKNTQTAFAHFVFPGVMRNVVESVTRVRPQQPAAFGNAIVALNPNACSGNTNGQQFRGLGGSGQLSVTGGGVFSNGCMDVDGNVDVTVTNGGVGYFYTANRNDLDDITITGGGDPAQLQNFDANRIPQTAYDIPVPAACLDSANDVDEDDLQDMQPLEGLYCVTGGLSINNQNENLVGTNLTLVFKGGKVLINGGTLDLKAPPNSYAGENGAIPGVLIYMPRQYYDCANASANSNTLQINGNAGNQFEGTVLAPCSSVELNGSSSNYAFNTQVIGYNVNIGGASGTSVIYQSDKNLLRPAFMDLYR